MHSNSKPVRTRTRSTSAKRTGLTATGSTTCTSNSTSRSSATASRALTACSTTSTLSRTAQRSSRFARCSTPASSGPQPCTPLTRTLLPNCVRTPTFGSKNLATTSLCWTNSSNASSWASATWIPTNCRRAANPATNSASGTPSSSLKTSTRSNSASSWVHSFLRSHCTSKCTTKYLLWSKKYTKSLTRVSRESYLRSSQDRLSSMAMWGYSLTPKERIQNHINSTKEASSTSTSKESEVSENLKYNGKNCWPLELTLFWWSNEVVKKITY